MVSEATPTNLGIEVRHPHFLPRIGAAYRIGEDSVIRGGYGITVSPLPLSRPLRGFYPLTINQQFVGPNGFVPFGTLAQGIPLFAGPDLSTGSVDLPATADEASPYSDHLNRGYIQSWNLAYERRLPGHFSLAASYVGTMTTSMMGFYDINAAAAGEGQAGQPLFQTFGRSSAFSKRYDGYLSGNYHALQLALNRPLTKGLFLKGAYTWSKAMNRQDDDGWAQIDWNHPSVMSKNYGPAGFDRTHVFQLGFVAELPFGKNGNGALDVIVKDWSRQRDPQLRQRDAVHRRLPPALRSTRRGTARRPTSWGARTSWAGSAPETPTTTPARGRRSPRSASATRAATPYADRAGRNIDLSLFRRFPIKRTTLEARIEAFNLTNTPHFRNPNGDVGSDGFMTITAAQPDQRQVRLGLRFSF